MFRLPWRSPKPRTNTDGGPPTCLFSFSRESERRTVERYCAGRPDLIEARYRLIDEVIAYRRTGELTRSLLDACEAEYRVAAWPYSQGMQRYAELALDGHGEAAARLAAYQTSPDWRERFEALYTGFRFGTDYDRRRLVRLGLNDRS